MSESEITPGTTLYAADLVDGRVVVREGVLVEPKDNTGQVLDRYVRTPDGRGYRAYYWHLTPEAAKAEMEAECRDAE